MDIGGHHTGYRVGGETCREGGSITGRALGLSCSSVPDGRMPGLRVEYEAPHLFRAA